jgi:hypothetical protein
MEIELQYDRVKTEETDAGKKKIRETIENLSRTN